MTVTYLYHSGFLVETKASYYIFDYWKGGLPRLSPEKPVVVFSSHAHPDHYEPKVFDLLKEQGSHDIYAVLGKDIPKGRYPQGIPCLRTLAHKTFSLPHGEELETLQSTDAGVAFLLKCDEGAIYHAGDLNDWIWEGEPEEDNSAMHQLYLREIARLKDQSIDVAFVPMDTRLSCHYADGLLEFLETVPHIGTVYPMHYWEQREKIQEFLADHPQYRGIVQDPES